MQFHMQLIQKLEHGWPVDLEKQLKLQSISSRFSMVLHLLISMHMDIERNE